MKSYSIEMTINRPAEETGNLFGAIDRYPEWQPDLNDYKTFEGEPGQSGAKSRLVFKDGKNDNVKMVEHIKENNLPHSFKVRYSTDGVTSYQTHTFKDDGAGGTLYHTDNEIDLDGLMKVMNIFSPKHFEKRTREFMESFKEFAESR